MYCYCISVHGFNDCVYNTCTADMYLHVRKVVIWNYVYFSLLFKQGDSISYKADFHLCPGLTHRLTTHIGTCIQLQQ